MFSEKKIVNIGPVLEKALYSLNINNLDELKKQGSKKVWLDIKYQDPST